MLRIDGADELKAAALIYSRAPKAVQAGIRKEAASWAPTLVAAAVRRAPDPVSRMVARSGRTRINRNGLVAVFGAGGLPSGGRLADVAAPYEFGTAQPEAKHTYLSRNRGRAVQVTRRVQRQIPGRAADGRFLHPAVADTTPELASRWVRVCAEAVTGGR